MDRVTSSPCLRMGLPPELGRRVGGSVAEVPAFARGFTHTGHICRFLGGSPRLSARRGISSPTATPSPWTHRFHPFGRPLSKGLSNLENGSSVFKLYRNSSPPSRTGSPCEVKINKEETPLRKEEVKG